MKKMIFTSPDGKCTEISENDAAKLRGAMIENFPLYWKQGSRSCNFELFDNDIIDLRLSVGFYEELGLCLTYEIFFDELIRGRTIRDSSVYLAVYDKNSLNETIDIYYELYTSKGLLFPPELAWKGISNFIRTGEKCAELEWITPEELPESGNWC